MYALGEYPMMHWDSPPPPPHPFPVGRAKQERGYLDPHLFWGGGGGGGREKGLAPLAVGTGVEPTGRLPCQWKDLCISPCLLKTRESLPQVGSLQEKKRRIMSRIYRHEKWLSVKREQGCDSNMADLLVSIPITKWTSAATCSTSKNRSRAHSYKVASRFRKRWEEWRRRRRAICQHDTKTKMYVTSRQ